jgi:ABC-type transport system involved in multi-copper enzyme maturation permease subunit
MVKELRSRFRGRRAFVVMTIYLGLLALLAYATYAVIAPSVRGTQAFGVGTANASATIGIAVFTVLSLFQLLLVCFIAPAFTTGAISLEREKQTLDLLISTPLRPGAIVVGKLLAALAYVGLMILAAIPISAIVFMYGGATVEDVVRQQGVLLVTALGLGAIGLFFSALIKRTQAATVLTYCAMLFLTVGTVLIWVFWTLMFGRDIANGSLRRAPEQILWVNPGVAMVDVIAGTDPGGSGSWSGVLNEILGVSSGGNIQGGGGVTCKGNVCISTDENGNPIPGAAPIAVPADCPPNAQCLPPGGFQAADQPSAVSGHFWTRFGITFGALAVLFTLISMRLVVPAGMRFVFRPSRRRQLASTTRASTGAASIPLPGDGDPEITPLEESAP